MKYLATVSYDGINYAGFQRQINAIGIQNVIERAFRLMTQQDIYIHSAGRTDKGVHAIAQTFHFETDLLMDEQTWLKGVNARLPLDIRINSIQRVKDGFHARHSAKSKIYRYHLAKEQPTVFRSRYDVYIPNLNIEDLKKGLTLLEGTHDFKGFCQYVPGKPTMKTIYKTSLKETKTHYYITFHGNSFLRYQVRSMVGTLIQVAQQKKSVDVIQEILTTQNRKLAGPTAPANGLYLVKVKY